MGMSSLCYVVKDLEIATVQLIYFTWFLPPVILACGLLLYRRLWANQKADILTSGVELCLFGTTPAAVSLLRAESATWRPERVPLILLTLCPCCVPIKRAQD